MTAVALAVHLLGAVVWVGGMFAIYVCLRPALGTLEPPQRLRLMRVTFQKFFPWVWLVILLLLASGYWMLFTTFGGFAGARLYIHLMQMIGWLRGRPPKLIRRDARHGPNSVKALAPALPANTWRTIKWREGSADWLSSRFARLRVRVAHRDYNLTESRPEEWLLIEWPEEEKEPTKYWLSTLPEGIALQRLVDIAKLRWRIERDYQELKQEVGLGHFEGRGWRGFHHHATLCIAAYGFLISERETIPPSGPRSTTLFPELTVPKGYRPRGSAATARASHPKLDRNHASTIDRRARQKLATMSMLQLP